jgi:hypothetical protein
MGWVLWRGSVWMGRGILLWCRFEGGIYTRAFILFKSLLVLTELTNTLLDLGTGNIPSYHICVHTTIYFKLSTTIAPVLDPTTIGLNHAQLPNFPSEISDTADFAILIQGIVGSSWFIDIGANNIASHPLAPAPQQPHNPPSQILRYLCLLILTSSDQHVLQTQTGGFGVFTLGAHDQDASSTDFFLSCGDIGSLRWVTAKPGDGSVFSWSTSTGKRSRFRKGMKYRIQLFSLFHARYMNHSCF